MGGDHRDKAGGQGPLAAGGARDGRGEQLRATRAAIQGELPKRAVTLYQSAREAIEAARALREEGDMPRALRVALQVAPQAPEYPAAARLAIAVAAARRNVDQELEDFLAPYLDSEPTDLVDQDAFFLLGQLYEVLDYSGMAQWLFNRLAKVNPLHPVHAYLRNAKKPAESGTIETQASGRDLRAVRQLLFNQAPRRSADSFEFGTSFASRYVLQNLLGSGATAAVYEAIDVLDDKRVAIKISSFSDRDLLATRRFRREATLAMRLIHPNIVRVYDVGQEAGHSFLVMELIDGQPLDALLGERLPDPSLPGKRALLMQVLAGLECAHAQGVTHRDIKPENMLVSRKGVLKIADFGLAKGNGDDRITASGVMGGSPAYISPEQITDIYRADSRSDLYSFGVVAYELLTGQRPFDASALTQLLVMHLNEEPRPLRSIDPSLPAALDAWVLKLLRKKPEERFQTAREARQALEVAR
jgi:serine/threonine-protein kinase